jgi:predicted metal-dependent peptidase
VPGLTNKYGEPTELTPARKAAVAMGKMAGNIPQNIERLVNDILEPVVDWEEVLKNMVVTRIGLDTLDWRKLNRRVFLVNGVINPARKSVRCGRIIFIVDVSGSTQEYVPQFVGGEIADVAESLQPKAIDVIWCDTRVAGVDTLEDAQAMDVGKLVVKGGGGTDLRPAFKHVQDELLDFGEEVACVIVLTDSETPWPDRDPGYPVIIATTAPKHPSNPKWAEIVEINEKQARRH